ncbi:hypothetical protein [Streptomyces sp. YGL11-2]|uniref:hypothetical protein n=1 Tax=Streptomyces sp. YGL11-2 TaxID=3414028 RepID=UPI003CF500B6
MSTARTACASRFPRPLHNPPVATVTEALTPAGASFRQWRTAQLQGIEQALAKAAAR